MKTLIAAAALAALSGLPLAAAAEDNEAGVPLTPAEAAGAWTLDAGSRPACVLTLGTQKVGAGYAVKAGSDCAGVLSATPAAWLPTADGMKLVTADGQTLIGFNRWSNSLFVSHRASGKDVQLRRGKPGAEAAPGA
jgi:hypothetical protein